MGLKWHKGEWTLSNLHSWLFLLSHTKPTRSGGGQNDDDGMRVKRPWIFKVIRICFLYGGINWIDGNEWFEMLAPCFVQIIPKLHTKSKIFTFFDRWLTMHICQTFIYRSIYFLIFKNLYENYHIYIACDWYKKQIFLSFVHIYSCRISGLFLYLFSSLSLLSLASSFK